MTSAEHELMIAMFTRQANAIQVLERIVRSLGVDDKSFKGAREGLQHAMSDDPKAYPLTSEIYRITAKGLSVDIPD